MPTSRVLRALFLFSMLLPAASLAADRNRARRAYERGLEHYLNGDFKLALSEINDAIEEKPGLIPAHALRARLWEIFGDTNLMQKDADRVIDKLSASLSSLDAQELVAYATALLLKGQTEHALASFSAALELNARSPEALAGRARTWRRKNNHAKALEDSNAALQRQPHTPLHLYNRAYAYYDLGRFDEAIADLTAALRINKNLYAAYGLLGASLARKGDAKRALQAYNKATAVNPEYAFAYLGRAALRLASGLDEAAFADLDEAVRVEAHHYAPYYNRAEAYWRRGNKTEATEDYRKALGAVALDPEYAVTIGDRLCQLLLWKEALEAYSRAYALAGGEEDRPSSVRNLSPYRMSAFSRPSPRQPRAPAKLRATLSPAGIRALVHRARAYDQGLKDPGRAMEDLSEAVERDPSASEAWAARGILHLRLGREREAISDLNQAVKLDPQNPAVRVARGSYHARTEKPKAALDDFNAAISADPRAADAYNNRGALYANQFNETEKALKDIEIAVALSPRDPDYLFNLAMMRLKARHYGKALEALNSALKNQGPPARILAQRADVHSQLGDHANALQDIQVALEKDPQHSPLYAVLGLVRLRAHSYEQAVRDLNQALELDPDNVQALIHRGQAYGAMGSLKNALKDFRRAGVLDPRSKEAFTHLCHARRLLKDPSEAAADCARAINLDAYYAPAYLHLALSSLAMREAGRTIENVETASRLGLKRAEGLLAQAVAQTADKQYPQAHKSYWEAVALDPTVHSPEMGFGAARPEEEGYYEAISDLEPLMRSEASNPHSFLVRGDALHSAQQYDKAVIEYTKALELDGNLSEAYLARGLTLMAQEAFDGAQQDLLRALELKAKDSATGVKLATLHTLRRNYNAALQETAKAVKLDPKNSEAHLRAANACYFQKNYALALSHYEQAVQIDPANASAHNGLGLGLFALKRYQEALESFSRAVALNPASDRFHRNRASTYTILRSFANAAAEFKSASLLNKDPSLIEEYRRLIDLSESRSSGGKS